MIDAPTAQACAEPDLFDDPAPAPAPETDRPDHHLRAVLRGRLTANAQVRSRACDREGHMVPVLCLELAELGPWKRTVHVELPYPVDAREQAEKRARELKRYAVVDVVSPITGLRMSLPNAESVEVVSQEAQA